MNGIFKAGAVADLQGDRELIAALGAIPGWLQQEAFVAALKKGGAPIARRAKANARRFKDTGLLAKSIGVVVRGKKKGRDAIAVIGARRDVSATMKRATRKKPTFERPANYAHFVEFGTVRSAANPFLRPAVDSGKGEARDAIVASLRDYHENKLPRKLVKQGGATLSAIMAA